MKRIMIVCVTYYQLILAVQMKLTIFREDDVTLVIHAGKTVGFGKVYQQLLHMSVFSKVYYFENEDIRKKGGFYLVKRFCQMIGGSQEYKKVFQKQYDEMIFYNVSPFSIILYASLADKSGRLEAARMEEGILSYGNPCSFGLRYTIARVIRKVMGRMNMLDGEYKYYCMFPDLVGFRCKKAVIPPLDVVLDELRGVLNRIFEYKPLKLHQNVIFFTTTSEEHQELAVKERELAFEISRAIGKNNLLIKKHPRDSSDVYEKNGLFVMKNSAVPWEVIQINQEPGERILLATTSGAFLNIAASLQNVEGCFLYQCLDDSCQKSIKSYTDQIQDDLVSLKQMGRCKKIEILKDKESLMKKLEKEGKRLA